ncbi:spore germination protein [Pelagirhabdus alkalitolerans]|uniref:Spore germination protein n=1 Tax=Pelagirhabdus alkalitolerans TaxID=1612202 RepID=A0A1G6HB90_9BACI|nr:germination protein YpeB [Pelagirhabdus alkalitolerans]SDB91461.1 spore germination protein [Pelagirhabdus alkalitolerans]
MKRWIVIALLGLTLLISVFWGLRINQQRDMMVVHAENNYQRAFHDLTYHLDVLHEEIGTTLALNSTERMTPQLIEIWRLTAQAQSDVAQLPLVVLPFNQTELYLSEVGDFTYDVAMRDLDENPLSDDELEKLTALYQTSEQIRENVRITQNQVLNEELKWVELEMLLTQGDTGDTHSLVDGLLSVNDLATDFQEAHSHTLSPTLPSQHDHFKHIDGEQVSADEAVEKIKDQFELDEEALVDLNTSEESAQLATYYGSFEAQENHGYVEVSQQGGHILNYMMNRDVSHAELGLNEAQNEAESFLNQQDLNSMTLLQAAQYDQIGVFEFVGLEDDVYVYPDKVMIKVALDDGAIVGFNATDYYRNHQKRDVEEPELTLQEAENAINHHLTVEDHHLAIIDERDGEEVLSYALFCTNETDTYRIFIDANTGREVMAEILHDVEPIWGL